MAFETKPIEHKVPYKELEKCVLKRIMGEHTEECKKVFDSAGVKD